MTVEAQLGPFRRDGRERVVAESLDGDAATRAIERSHRFELQLPGYLLVLALGPAAVGLAISSVFAAVPCLFLLSLTWIAFKQYRDARRKNTAQAVEPRRAWLTDDGIFIDGVLGPARWGWSAARGMSLVEGAVVLDMGRQEALVLRRVGADGERLIAFLRARIASRIVDRPGRIFLMLAVLYALCVAAGITILPAPP